jgi:molybdopterin-guanine dinucleotide biosynthesis protein A
MISIAIQAGGESRRMGEEKALLPFLGTTLIQRVINRVETLGDELLITTNRPQVYQKFNLPLFEDLLPGHGALGGLYTALSAATYPVVIVVACDMPFVNADILSLAIRELDSNEVDVVIPETTKGYEPFHAVYHRENCLPVIRRALDAGERKLISWFPEVKIRVIPDSVLKLYDPQQIAFINLNTREEFLKAEQLAREVG